MFFMLILSLYKKKIIIYFNYYTHITPVFIVIIIIKKNFNKNNLNLYFFYSLKLFTNLNYLVNTITKMILNIQFLIKVLLMLN